MATLLLAPHRAILASALCISLSACASPPPAAPSSASSAPSTTAAKPALGNVRVTWLGHAAFEVVSSGGTRLLIDPWVRENPKTPAAWKDISRFAKDKPAAILITHAHGDHAPDVPAIAEASGALVVAPGEHLRAMKIPEAQQRSINPGGPLRVGDVTIYAVPAMHSMEPGGRPLGFVVTFADGRSLYHTGDTGVFGDMALIEELHHPDILLLEAGGARWGLDPKMAAFAVRKYFTPRVIVPMHFGTFPEMSPESEVRATFGADPRVRFLTPGEPAML